MTFYCETNFQESTAGKIPKNWTIKTTKEMGEVITGITPSTLVKEYWNGDYPFVTPTDITKQKYVEKTERKVSTRGLEKGRIIPKDSVLVTCIASIGKIALAFEDCLTNQQINAIICKKEMNPHYVYYAIGFRASVLESWAGKTTSPIVKKSLFEKFPIPIPTTASEQQAIAGVLGVVDSAIEYADRVVVKTERLKRGLMQQLLTQGIGHTEYKAVKEFGFNIPKEWNSVSIYDIKADMKGAIVSGPFGSNIGKRFFVEKGIPLIRGNNLTKGEKLFIDEGFVFVSEQKAEQEKSCTALPNDLIFTAAGTLGQIGLIPENTRYAKYIISNKQLRARIDRKKALPLFIFYWFSSDIIKNMIKNKQTGTSIPVINLSILRSLPILLPDVSEQEKITKILLEVDIKLKLEREAKAKLERIKRGLMDLLLTGKVRIKEN